MNYERHAYVTNLLIGRPVMACRNELAKTGDLENLMKVVQVYHQTLIDFVLKEAEIGDFEINGSVEVPNPSCTASYMFNDIHTARHSVRTGFTGLKTGLKLRERGNYGDILDEEYIANIFHAGCWHDVGKREIEPELLKKTEPLTENEKKQIRQHEREGALIAGKMNDPKIAEMIYHHHKCKDMDQRIIEIDMEGSPLGSYIISVCDKFDSMVTPRSYRKEGVKKPGEAMAEMRKDSIPGIIIDVFEGDVLADREFIGRVYKGTVAEEHFL